MRIFFFFAASLPFLSSLLATNEPFLGFAFANQNEAAVGNNIDALALGGTLAANGSLSHAVGVLSGQGNKTISSALDQMHPASYSAFAEIQAENGSQLLSFFCKAPFRSCQCHEARHVWVESFANWYDQKNVGEQIGFGSATRGFAAGFDMELLEDWIMGIGGVWQYSDLSWHWGRGHGDAHGYYGAFYTDYQIAQFYIGASVLAGVDERFASRHIQYLSINTHAEAKSQALDVMTQLTLAYFFGPPTFLIYPLVNLDFFYLQNGSFQEQSAGGLDLEVKTWADKTMRTEGALALQLLEVNRDETICFSPLLILGWVMQNPIGRGPLTSNFLGEPISFETHGWDQTWQLWSARLGFRLNVYCLAISADYRVEVTIDGDDYFAQKGDVRIEWNW